MTRQVAALKVRHGGSKKLVLEKVSDIGSDANIHDDVSLLLQATSFFPTVKQVYDAIGSLDGDSGAGEDCVSA